MKPGIRGFLGELFGYALGKALEKLFGQPPAPTAAELDEALTTGGPTADAAARARADVEEAKLRSAAGRSMVDDEAPSFGVPGEPRREDLN